MSNSTNHYTKPEEHLEAGNIFSLADVQNRFPKVIEALQITDPYGYHGFRILEPKPDSGQMEQVISEAS